MNSPHGYIYFIFVGYRVAIGKTKNLYSRMTDYRRSRYEIQVLGLIPCQSKDELETREKQLLNQFRNCNAFRDIFYLTPEMIDWIVENTIPMSKKISESLLRQVSRRNAKQWRENPEYRKKQRDRKQRTKKQSFNTDTLKIPEL